MFVLFQLTYTYSLGKSRAAEPSLSALKNTTFTTLPIRLNFLLDQVNQVKYTNSLVLLLTVILYTHSLTLLNSRCSRSAEVAP